MHAIRVSRMGFHRRSLFAAARAIFNFTTPANEISSRSIALHMEAFGRSRRCFSTWRSSSFPLMREKDHTLEIPPKQKMERQKTLVKEHKEEHKAALRRAVSLAVPHAFAPNQYGTFDEKDDEDDSNNSIGDSSTGRSSTKSLTRENWDDLIERLFERDESGHMILKKPLVAD